MFEAPECFREFGVDEQGIHGQPLGRKRGCWASTIGRFRPRFPDGNRCGPARCGGLVRHLFSHRAAGKLYKRDQFAGKQLARAANPPDARRTRYNRLNATACPLPCRFHRALIQRPGSSCSGGSRRLDIFHLIPKISARCFCFRVLVSLRLRRCSLNTFTLESSWKSSAAYSTSPLTFSTLPAT